MQRLVTTLAPINILFSSINPNNLTSPKKELAKILAAKFGSCEFVHYGLCGEDGQNRDLQEQQLEFTKKITHLVKDSIEPNSRVLLDGPSLAIVAQNLADANHQVCWLHHGAREIEQDLKYQNLSIRDQQLCYFDGALKFQIIAIEGSYHYLQQLELLTKSRVFFFSNCVVFFFLG